jgi:hypothetical protein
MAYIVREFQATPNPNAVKCLLDHPVVGGQRSYFDAASASGDPLATLLFAVEGVTNLLIHGDWITVSKKPEADWRRIKGEVKRVLRRFE